MKFSLTCIPSNSTYENRWHSHNDATDSSDVRQELSPYCRLGGEYALEVYLKEAHKRERLNTMED